MYDSKFAGAKCTSVNGGVSVPSPDSLNMTKWKDGTTFTSTGYYVSEVGKDGNQEVMLLCTNGQWIVNNYTSTGSPLYDYGWNYQLKPTASSNATQRDAQSLLNKIIANNKRILENNMLCRRFAKYLTAAQRQDVKILQQNLEWRNERLTTAGALEGIKYSSPDQLAQYGASKYDINAVATTIIVAAVVTLAASAAIYYLYKTLLKDSEADVKYSDEFTKTLMEKLTEEEYEQLKQETAGMITKAKIKARFSGAASATKLLLIGGLILFAMPMLKKTKKQLSK